MRPIQKTISIAAADPNGVAEAQTPIDGDPIALDGVLYSGGVATFIYPTQVTLTSADDLSTVTFTVYGLVLNADGTQTQGSEVVTGPNNDTVTTTLTFVNVSLITVATLAVFTTET